MFQAIVHQNNKPVAVVVGETYVEAEDRAMQVIELLEQFAGDYDQFDAKMELIDPETNEQAAILADFYHL